MSEQTGIGTFFAGYSLAEYQAIFDLTEQDLHSRILGVASGYSSFNAELTRRGGRVISCDALYQLSPTEVERSIRQRLAKTMRALLHDKESYLWHSFNSPKEFEQTRKTTMQIFLEDFPQGIRAGRYRVDSLPNLEFSDHEFDLALSSHFLFCDQCADTTEALAEAIIELCRVAKEARVFPLLDPQGNTSALLGPVMLYLQERDYGLELREVPYQFQRGGNAMLRVWANVCEVC